MRIQKRELYAIVCGGTFACLLLWACSGDDNTGRPPAGPDCKLTPSACQEAGPDTASPTDAPAPDTAKQPDVIDSGGSDSPSDAGTDTASKDASDGSSDAQDEG